MTDFFRVAWLVVRKDLMVEARSLELGPANDGLVVVRRGLVPGEQVVIRGQFALGPGARIITRPPGGGAPQPPGPGASPRQP